MRALDLDYAPARSAGVVAWVLLVAAVIVTGDIAARYQTLAREIELKRSRLGRLASYHAAPKISRSALTPEEYAFARQTAARLSTPWDQLFQALEAAARKDVALLTVEPDIQNRAITLTGEAKDYLAALSYAAGLSEQKSALANVRLQRHEARKSGSETRVAFSVSATWIDGR